MLGEIGFRRDMRPEEVEKEDGDVVCGRVREGGRAEVRY